MTFTADFDRRPGSRGAGVLPQTERSFQGQPLETKFGTGHKSTARCHPSPHSDGCRWQCHHGDGQSIRGHLGDDQRSFDRHYQSATTATVATAVKSATGTVAATATATAAANHGDGWGEK